MCTAIAKGIHLTNADIKTNIFPISDGGEGSMDILAFHLGGRKKQLTVNDPLLRPVKAEYLISKNGETAFVELAKASGLQLLTNSERNPMLTSTFGFGEMIADAINEGVTNIVMTIGGSATHDGGMGMATALGYRFYGEDGHPLKGSGKDLGKVISMEVDDDVKNVLAKVKFTTICDVTNPLIGSQGAAQIFAKQKGATDEDIKYLDQGLDHLSNILGAEKLAEAEGSGAAGGVGFGTVMFLQSKLQKGIQTIMELTGFESQIRNCDLIITGEGKLDSQTNHGKLIQGICTLAAKYDKPVIALCGSVEASADDISKLGLAAAFPISDVSMPLDDALNSTAENLEKCTKKMIQNLLQRFS